MSKPFLAAIGFYACLAPIPVFASESVLLCTAQRSSIVRSFNGEYSINVVLEKSADGVTAIKMKRDGLEPTRYTLKRNNVNPDKSQKPIYNQLIREDGKVLALVDNKVVDEQYKTYIYDTGRFEEVGPFYTSVGQCEKKDKLF